MPKFAFVLLAAVAAGPAWAGIEDLTYPSKLLGQDVPIKVYTPPGYDGGADRYPVVYNLHGGGGSPQRQWDRTRKTLTDAMDNNRAKPVIYVFVNGLGNSEFVNTADGKPIERSIVEELIPFIDGKYRTIAKREARAIDGFSMGGFGCLSVALRNPDKFCAVCSYGAALTITAKGRNYKSSEHFAEHNPWDVVKANPDAVRKSVRVRMACGDADGLYDSNVRFKDLLESLQIPVDWVPVPGVAHNTMGLYEEVGLESLGFLHESFDLAAKGGPMDVRAKRTAPVRGALSGVTAGDEPPPFRPAGPLPRLKVSENGHFLVTADGRPFFWLADTAWLLAQNLDGEGVDKYLEDRATKQFSVVLTHIAPWKPGDTNAYGETAFVGNDFNRPNEAYWKHVDHVVNQAAAKGLYVGVLPLWCRNYVNRKSQKDAPPLIDAPTARAYGRWLGERYREKSHVVWVLGGDAEPKHPDIFGAMAAGIEEGVGGPDNALITYHPKGTPDSSATWFHDRPWLDFNMIQSSHSVWKANYVEIARDYALRPAKPVVEGEPCYENHPIQHKPANGHFTDWHVRVKAYWSVFAGGCGFTYGGNGVWQMDRDGKPPHRASHHTQTWDKALDLPGATQMKHLRRLMESRPVLSRVPDEGTVLASPPGEKEDRVQVARGADRTWAMYYLTTGQRVSAQVANLKGPTVAAWWFNPRDGKTYDNAGKPTDRPFATLPITGGKRSEFDPPGDPGEGNDWVLVLDTEAKNYPPPGQLRETPR